MEGTEHDLAGRRPSGRCGALLAAGLAVLALTACGGEQAAPTTEGAATTERAATTAKKPAKPAGPRDPTMNERTRAYIVAVQTCQVAVGLALNEIQKGSSDFEVADAVTTARDTCDTIRSRLLTLDTDHFDDQAALAWSGVDRMKSGMNAVLAYFENPNAAKLVEARNKIQEGDQDAALGLRQINARRVVYGLKKVKLP